MQLAAAVLNGAATSALPPAAGTDCRCVEEGTLVGIRDRISSSVRWGGSVC